MVGYSQKRLCSFYMVHFGKCPTQVASICASKSTTYGVRERGRSDTDKKWVVLSAGGRKVLTEEVSSLLYYVVNAAVILLHDVSRIACFLALECSNSELHSGICSHVGRSRMQTALSNSVLFPGFRRTLCFRFVAMRPFTDRPMRL